MLSIRDKLHPMKTEKKGVFIYNLVIRWIIYWEIVYFFCCYTIILSLEST